MVIISAPPMNCTEELSPPQNGSISDHSVPALPDTHVTFQCSDGLFPEGIMTVTCLSTGEWDRNPAEIVCRNNPSMLIFCICVSVHSNVLVFTICNTSRKNIVIFLPFQSTVPVLPVNQ